MTASLKPNYSKKQPVRNGHGLLSRLVLCILNMGLAYSVLNVHFGPVYLLQVSKNDDEEHCFLK